jgi:hypothetical protein
MPIKASDLFIKALENENVETAAAYAQPGAMPMLMITGQKPIKKSKQGRFQIVDTMRPITKFAKQVIVRDMIRRTIRPLLLIGAGANRNRIDSDHQRRPRCGGKTAVSDGARRHPGDSRQYQSGQHRRGVFSAVCNPSIGNS